MQNLDEVHFKYDSHGELRERDVLVLDVKDNTVCTLDLEGIEPTDLNSIRECANTLQNLIQKYKVNFRTFTKGKMIND